MRLHLFNGSLDFEVCREKSRGSSFRSSRRFPRVVLFGVPIVTDLGFPRFFTTRPSVRKSGIQTRSPGDSCSPSTICVCDCWGVPYFPYPFSFPLYTSSSMQAREAIWVAVYLDDMAFFVFSLEPILNCAGYCCTIAGSAVTSFRKELRTVKVSDRRFVVSFHPQTMVVLTH